MMTKEIASQKLIAEFEKWDCMSGSTQVALTKFVPKAVMAAAPEGTDTADYQWAAVEALMFGLASEKGKAAEKPEGGDKAMADALKRFVPHLREFADMLEAYESAAE